MITRSDWVSVGGEPPTSEEMMKYTRGELSPEDAATVRERLVAYPDLVRTLTAPFPQEGAEPGDSDYLSDQEFAAHWASLQQRMHRSRVSQFWPVISAIAAALAITFGTLLVQTKAELRRERLQPRIVWDEQPLLPDGQRGGGEQPATLTAYGESFLLLVPVSSSTFDDYRIEIINHATHQSLWTSPTIPLANKSAIAVDVPRDFLKSGTYEVVLIGVSGERQERVATHTLRAP